MLRAPAHRARCEDRRRGRRPAPRRRGRPPAARSCSCRRRRLRRPAGRRPRTAARSSSVPSAATATESSPLSSLSCSTCTGVLDRAGALDGLNRRPAERRRRHLSDDGRAGARDDPHVPLAVLGARRRLELVLELVDVEPDRVVFVVHLERDRPLARSSSGSAVASKSSRPCSRRRSHSGTSRLGTCSSSSKRLVALRPLARRPACRPGSSSATSFHSGRDAEARARRAQRGAGRGVEGDDRSHGASAAASRAASSARPIAICSASAQRTSTCVGDLVRRAAADRVVRGVLDHPPPGEVEQALRPALRRTAPGAARRSASGPARPAPSPP